MTQQALTHASYYKILLPDPILPDEPEMGLVTGWRALNSNHVQLTILSGRNHDLTAEINFASDRGWFTGTDFNQKTPIEKSLRVNNQQ